MKPIRPIRLYEAVASRIRETHLQALRPGARLPSEARLSEEYGVSIPTIREALRSLTQAGHVVRRQGSGTFKRTPPSAPAPAPPPRADRRVAIVCPLDLTHGTVSCHFTQLALGLEKSLRERGLRAELHYGETAPSSARTYDDGPLCDAIRADALSCAVLISEPLRDAPYRALLQDRGVPVLQADLTPTANGRTFDEDFVARAVERLTRHGRKRIACLGFGSRPQLAAIFASAASEHGASTEESWIAGDLHPNESGAGYSLLREIWTGSRAKPDGLILCDDVFFQDTALGIRDLRIAVPGQLMIACRKNTGVRLVAPFPVIEFAFDTMAMARGVAAQVEALVGGGATTPYSIEVEISDPFDTAGEDPTGIDPSI